MLHCILFTDDNKAKCHKTCLFFCQQSKKCAPFMKPVKDEGEIVIHLNPGVWLHACREPHMVLYNFIYLKYGQPTNTLQC